MSPLGEARNLRRDWLEFSVSGVLYSAMARVFGVLSITLCYCTQYYSTWLYFTFSTRLYFTLLRCIVLHCTVLRCTVLHCTVKHCCVLRFTVLVLDFTVMHFTPLYSSTMHWSPKKIVSNFFRCSILQGVGRGHSGEGFKSVLVSLLDQEFCTVYIVLNPTIHAISEN